MPPKPIKFFLYPNSHLLQGKFAESSKSLCHPFSQTTLQMNPRDCRFLKKIRLIRSAKKYTRMRENWKCPNARTTKIVTKNSKTFPRFSTATFPLIIFFGLARILIQGMKYNEIKRRQISREQTRTMLFLRYFRGRLFIELGIREQQSRDIDTIKALIWGNQSWQSAMMFGSTS